MNELDLINRQRILFNLPTDAMGHGMDSAIKLRARGKKAVARVPLRAPGGTVD